MSKVLFIFTITIYSLSVIQCSSSDNKKEKTEKKIQSLYSEFYKVDKGNAAGVTLTSYSTTIIANGQDKARLRITLSDSMHREITPRNTDVRLYVNGSGSLQDINNKEIELKTDTSGIKYAELQIVNGECNLYFVAGIDPGKTKIEAVKDGLWPGAHEIHLIPSTFEYKTPTQDQLTKTDKQIPNMIGADISWLPEMENEWGVNFYEDDKEIDPFKLLKEHGMNIIRLRVFVNPENEKGYSPEKGYCDLDHTLAMAKRTKEAGMLFLLDFHYSDYWADPQQQFKPKAWQNLAFDVLCDTLENYTISVLKTFKAQGLMPDMVQVGNEINHGMVWPDGHIGNPDKLAALLKAGVKGVREVSPEMPVMMHIALGGQNKESVMWLDNMIARGVQFDIIGLSYYPQWHGNLDDLNNNARDLVKRYNKPINIVEYNDFTKEVHDISFALPDNMGKGACIWEPLSNRSGLFSEDGAVNSRINIYDSLSARYLK